jgi:hypothetical protein
MYAYRFVDLSATPDQTAEGQMGIDRIVVHNHGFDKRIDGKIGALVQ